MASMKQLLFFCALFFSLSSNAQRLTILVVDSADGDRIPSAMVLSEAAKQMYFTTDSGTLDIPYPPLGKRMIRVSATGYFSKQVQVPENTQLLRIALASRGQTETVVISSSRTGARIEDLAMKVEVLGEEEMDEESVLVPGGIGSILGDLAVITIQRTNPVNGNDAVRMQGLDYKYTQLLRDGLPLFEGFSGSLGVLSIPPLDLKQVEIVKGANSTLYGGGAIAGTINFISKTPTDTPLTTFLINRTSLNETNLNTFNAKRNGKWGYTLFTGLTTKQAFDINKDGFAEVPKQQHITIHPRLFFEKKEFKADLGVSYVSDQRTGGDMNAILNGPSADHPYSIQEDAQRSTLDGHFTHKINSTTLLQGKASLSAFNRNLNYNGFQFQGTQTSSYEEVSLNKRIKRSETLIGAAFTLEDFQRKSGDSVNFTNYSYQTVGLFVQETFTLNDVVTLEAGVRGDHHSRYGNFLMPSAAVLIRPGKKFSARLRYGSGYKTPNLFVASQPQDYRYLYSVENAIKAERSQGINLDINYHTMINDEILIQVNQAFYYTSVFNPTIVESTSPGMLHVVNAPFNVRSIGTDTYVRMKIDEMEFYLGYNHTEALQLGTNIRYNMPFNPKDKLAATVLYEVEGVGRVGVEAAYNMNQYITGNVRVPNFWFFAAMAEYKLKKGSLVLNCENLANYRQSNYQSLYTGTVQSPIFRSVWGPLEGRVLNLAYKMTL